MSDVKRGGRHALMAVDEEQALRDLGVPIRCCDLWPECSHVLAWYEKQRNPRRRPVDPNECQEGC